MWRVSPTTPIANAVSFRMRDPKSDHADEESCGLLGGDLRERPLGATAGPKAHAVMYAIGPPSEISVAAVCAGIVFAERAAPDAFSCRANSHILPAGKRKDVTDTSLCCAPIINLWGAYWPAWVL